MKHLLIFISFLLLLPQTGFMQEHNIHPVSYIFDPKANAKQDINDAVQRAAKEHKHVFIVIGGDWSLWSRTLITFFKRPDIKNYMEYKYIMVLINFSPENRNSELLATYACPKDQGYPIVLVLDGQGNKVHMQDLDKYKVISKWYTGYDNEALTASIKAWPFTDDTQKLTH